MPPIRSIRLCTVFCIHWHPTRGTSVDEEASIAIGWLFHSARPTCLSARHDASSLILPVPDVVLMYRRKPWTLEKTAYKSLSSIYLYYYGFACGQAATTKPRWSFIPSGAFRAVEVVGKGQVKPSLSEHESKLTCFFSSMTIGTKRRLPSPPCIRTIRRRQENSDYCDPQRTLRPWSWEDQDRRKSLPDL